MDTLRLGKISTINYKDGTARVLYTDRDNAVTAELPLLSFEYRMPAVDDFVLVCHLPNGGAAGIILGPIWNDNNRPPEGKEGLYRKDFDKTAGKCFLRYDGNELQLVAPKLTLSGASSADWDELLARIEKLERHTHTDSMGGSTSAPK
jgi:hypothetical protein